MAELSEPYKLDFDGAKWPMSYGVAREEPPSFKIDRYGGTYSITRVPYRWWDPRGWWPRLRRYLRGEDVIPPVHDAVVGDSAIDLKVGSGGYRRVREMARAGYCEVESDYMNRYRRREPVE